MSKKIVAFLCSLLVSSMLLLNLAVAASSVDESHADFINSTSPKNELTIEQNNTKLATAVSELSKAQTALTEAAQAKTAAQERIASAKSRYETLYPDRTYAPSAQTQTYLTQIDEDYATAVAEFNKAQQSVTKAKRRAMRRAFNKRKVRRNNRRVRRERLDLAKQRNATKKSTIAEFHSNAATTNLTSEFEDLYDNCQTELTAAKAEYDAAVAERAALQADSAINVSIDTGFSEDATKFAALKAEIEADTAQAEADFQEAKTAYDDVVEKCAAIKAKLDAAEADNASVTTGTTFFSKVVKPNGRGNNAFAAVTKTNASRGTGAVSLTTAAGDSVSTSWNKVDMSQSWVIHGTLNFGNGNGYGMAITVKREGGKHAISYRCNTANCYGTSYGVLNMPGRYRGTLAGWAFKTADSDAIYKISSAQISGSNLLSSFGLSSLGTSKAFTLAFNHSTNQLILTVNGQTSTQSYTPVSGKNYFVGISASTTTSRKAAMGYSGLSLETGRTTPSSSSSSSALDTALSHSGCAITPSGGVYTLTKLGSCGSGTVEREYDMTKPFTITADLDFGTKADSRSGDGIEFFVKSIKGHRVGTNWLRAFAKTWQGYGIYTSYTVNSATQLGPAQRFDSRVEFNTNKYLKFMGVWDPSTRKFSYSFETKSGSYKQGTMTLSSSADLIGKRAYIGFYAHIGYAYNTQRVKNIVVQEKVSALPSNSSSSSTSFGTIYRIGTYRNGSASSSRVVSLGSNTYRLTPRSNSYAGAVWSQLTSPGRDVTMTAQLQYVSSAGADGFGIGINCSSSSAIGRDGRDVGFGGNSYFHGFQIRNYDRRIYSSYGNSSRGGYTSLETSSSSRVSRYSNYNTNVIFRWDYQRRVGSSYYGIMYLTYRGYTYSQATYLPSRTCYVGVTAATGGISQEHRVKLLTISK